MQFSCLGLVFVIQITKRTNKQCKIASGTFIETKMKSILNMNKIFSTYFALILIKSNVNFVIFHKIIFECFSKKKHNVGGIRLMILLCFKSSEYNNLISFCRSILMLIEMIQNILYPPNLRFQEFLIPFGFALPWCWLVGGRKKKRREKRNLFCIESITHKRTKGAISLISMQVVSFISDGAHIW